MEANRKRPLLDEIDDDVAKSKKPPQKRVRFPKGKKVKPGAEVTDLRQEDEDVQPELTNAQRAAKERRNRRKQLQEDTEMLHDISVAEERYEDDGTFVDDGVQMEPFNLTNERKEGYFEEDGNFVEYVNKNEIKDAWLDNVMVDPKFGEGSFAETVKEDENVELSSREIAAMKRRIADFLEPGETVLQALRRLKGTSSGNKEKMSAETKEIFDQLTEDAVRLMENGEYNVYEEKKEVFQREAEGYERLAQARGEGTSTNSEQADDAFDMFAEDVSEKPNPVSDGNSLVPDPNSNSNSQPSESGSSQNDYLYDESSGYYYSSSSGYYYDPSTGLYCFAASGQWYSFNEETSTYDEVQATASILSE